LKSLVEGMVSFEHTLKADSPEEILKAAIESEKDAVSFYVAMRNAVPEALGKSKIDQIIKEEAAHAKLLGAQLGKLIGGTGDVEIDTRIPKEKEEKKTAKPENMKEIRCVSEEGKTLYEKNVFKESVEHEKVEVWGEDGIDSDTVMMDDE
jgi:rubrerythrin